MMRRFLNFLGKVYVGCTCRSRYCPKCNGSQYS